MAIFSAPEDNRIWFSQAPTTAQKADSSNSDVILAFPRADTVVVPRPQRMSASFPMEPPLWHVPGCASSCQDTARIPRSSACSRFLQVTFPWSPCKKLFHFHKPFMLQLASSSEASAEPGHYVSHLVLDLEGALLGRLGWGAEGSFLGKVKNEGKNKHYSISSLWLMPECLFLTGFMRVLLLWAAMHECYYNIGCEIAL